MASQLTYTGKATVTGFKGDVTPNGVAGVASFSKSSGDFGTEYKEDQLADSENNPIGFAFSGGLVVGNLTFTPVAASKAALATAMEEPAIGSRVTLANFQLASLNHARWAYTGGWKVAYTRDGIVTYSLTIKCAKDSTVDLSAAVS